MLVNSALLSKVLAIELFTKIYSVLLHFADLKIDKSIELHNYMFILSTVVKDAEKNMFGNRINIKNSQ